VKSYYHIHPLSSELEELQFSCDLNISSVSTDLDIETAPAVLSCWLGVLLHCVLICTLVCTVIAYACSHTYHSVVLK